MNNEDAQERLVESFVTWQASHSRADRRAKGWRKPLTPQAIALRAEWVRKAQELDEAAKKEDSND